MDRPPAAPAPAYIYSDEYMRFDYGPEHPLRISRLGLTHALIAACSLDQPAEPVAMATTEELSLFHEAAYLETLRRLSRDGQGSHLSYGLGPGDNPVFDGLYDWSALLTGASLAAGRLVCQGGHHLAFSMAGGMHHALAARASGFCYLNDIVVLIRHLLARGLRVAYIDIDAHHGDGVQWAFFDSDEVLTISLHQHPATLFPGTGYLEETGTGAGKGYSVNLPLWPDANDDIFMDCFDQVVPPLVEAFAPDCVVTQLGVDTFLTDPLANLNLTTRGFGHCVRVIKELADGRWIALGGGGYNIVNVARAWTLAWAIMVGREDQVPEMMPEDYCRRLRIPEDNRRLLDNLDKVQGRFWARSARDAQDAIAFVKNHHFPILGARG